MGWVGAWFILAGIAAAIIGLVQLGGAHDAWIVPTFLLIGATAIATGVGVMRRSRPAQVLGVLLSVAGVLAGFVVLVAFVPILDVVEGGWGTLSPVILWMLIFITCGGVLARVVWRRTPMP